jgi:hypothetical protein
MSRLHPRDVLTDLIGSADFPVEIADPEAAADLTLGRLYDAGFAIVDAIDVAPEQFAFTASPLKGDRDGIAAIIDPQAMALAHKLGRPDAVLTAEMQTRILKARGKADTIAAFYGSAQS